MAKPLRVLVACEFSGVVRDAFLRLGHDAVSCDLLPTESEGPHIQDDVLNHLSEGWDLLIAHPPCTYLCNSGVRHLYIGGKKVNGRDEKRWYQMSRATEFFLALWSAPIDKICIENPIMHGHAKRLIGVNQSQIIQPWQFGHGEIKATCLWLKNLPLLLPTSRVDGRVGRTRKEVDSKFDDYRI